MRIKTCLVVLAMAVLAAAQTAGPSRIVSLVPAITEMLYAIGAGGEVAGVSSYDEFPPEVASKPRVGALLDPDFERILSLKPDLVVVYGTQHDLIGRLERARVPIFVNEHAGLADITSTIRQLGRRLGRAARAEEVAAGIERDLADVRRRVAGRPRPKTALIFGREPGSLRSIYASAGVGFMHDMLEAAGGADAFGDVARQSLQATSEVLLARGPEVILEVHPSAGWTPARLAAEREIWKGLPGIPAVKAGRVYLLADDRIFVPGPRVAEAVRVMARVLHPGAFEK
jgi:iron complex transport system substrate-binding protein